MELPLPPDDNATLEGLNVAVIPDEDVAVRVIVPLNPPRLTRLRVEVEDEPARKLTVVGLAVRL